MRLVRWAKGSTGSTGCVHGVHRHGFHSTCHSLTLSMKSEAENTEEKQTLGDVAEEATINKTGTGLSRTQVKSLEIAELGLVHQTANEIREQ